MVVGVVVVLLWACFTQVTPKDAVLVKGTLVTNLGLPLVVVGTKADQLEALVARDTAALVGAQASSHKQSKTHILNFIQGHLRKWCLANGGALIYTSAHTNLNTSLLLNYALHRVYGFPFPKDKPMLKPEAVFCPFGSDSSAEIAKLPVDAISSNGMDASYNVVIKAPTAQAGLEGLPSVQSTDHQAFLEKQELLRRDRDPEASKGSLSLSTSKSQTNPALKKSAELIRSPRSGGKKVEQDAEKFFASMLKNYRK